MDKKTRKEIDELRSSIGEIMQMVKEMSLKKEDSTSGIIYFILK